MTRPEIDYARMIFRARKAIRRDDPAAADRWLRLAERYRKADGDGPTEFPDPHAKRRRRLLTPDQQEKRRLTLRRLNELLDEQEAQRAEDG